MAENLVYKKIIFYEIKVWYSGSQKSEVTITREGDYEISSKEIAEEINLFSGKQKEFDFEHCHKAQLSLWLYKRYFGILIEQTFK